ncbi:MAG: protelomerase family protein [Cyanobacteriota bacterium]|nr:protelomerase family protein [Cyanobacteriota bacterium]
MSQALKQKLLELYEQVKEMRSLKEIEAATIPVRDWIDSQSWTLATRGKNLSKCGLNKIFNQIPLEEGLNAIQIAKHDADGNVTGYQLRHYVIHLLQLTAEQWAEVNAGGKVVARLENEGTPIDPEKYLKVTGELLADSDPAIVCIGLAAATGRRPTEIIFRGQFELVENQEYSLLFKEGLLKQKGRETPPFHFPVLFPAKFILNRLKSVRSHQLIRDCVQQIEKECLDDEIRQNEIISNRVGRTIRRKISGLFEKNLELRLNETDHNQKGLRAAYACLSVSRDFPGSPAHQMLKYGQILGHLIEGESISKPDLNNLVTSLGYADYYVPSGVKVPFPEAPKIAMAREQNKSIRIRPQTQDRIKKLSLDDENYSDTLERIMDESERVPNLEKALLDAKAEIEKLKAELLTVTEPIKQPQQETETMDKAAIKELIKECLSEMDLTATTTVETTVEPVTERPSRSEQDKEIAQKMSNEALWGGKLYPDEKIRRSYVAVCEYNDAIAPNNSERLALTTQSLRALSGCNGRIVGDWMKDHASEILSHHAKYEMLNPKDEQSLTTYFNKGKDQDKILGIINEKLLGGVAKL